MSFPFHTEIEPHWIRALVKKALEEDNAFADVTTKSLTRKDEKIRAFIFAREKGILCGLPFAEETFLQCDQEIKTKPLLKEGSVLKKETKVMEIEGGARGILAGERVALNFLMILSGIATKTYFFQKALGKKIVLLDTRKTTPAFRQAEKYAVTIGGGKNHRPSLKEMILIKDTHKALYKNDLSALLHDLYSHRLNLPVEVEVASLKEARTALTFPVDGLLLDNMPYEEMKKSVALARKKHVFVEISGNVDEKKLPLIKKLSPAFVSTSATILKSHALDFSLEISSS